ncbi:hypothetical protein [Methylovulum psychrotolerans]|uniref:Uncharacterized protein n=1 Tax=Methylovulum psychrotolerans TaxID=1704499 RepID=A0A2S5CFF4_9GAMM|nr:hypothetical protein [Methylovulum psychrotolerans]POZ49534.1 hypothetical protein AADEFJLK_04699 [Methylovulum psychrotolerans]
MINKLELMGYILFVLDFLFMLIVGELAGEYFVEHFLVKLPLMLQKPGLPYLFILFVFRQLINPYENNCIWKKFATEIDSKFHQFSWIGSLNSGFLIGFIIVWHNPNGLRLWRLVYALCCE